MPNYKTIEQILLDIEKEWDLLKNAVKSEDQPGEFRKDDEEF
jgi:hypothetical protein